MSRSDRERLSDIAEAIKDVSPELLANEPATPWSDIAGMRDLLTHRYFDTSHGIVAATVDSDLPLLQAAVDRLLSIASDPGR